MQFRPKASCAGAMETWYAIVTHEQEGAGHACKTTAADLPAIDASLICDAALRLTKEFGIDGWSIRQLAKEIDARPNVINYHVGRREDVVHLVMERVNAEISLPGPCKGWKPWFRLLLGELRRTLRKYPGVARRLAAIGPGLGESNRIINQGIQMLEDAGFNDQSAFAYSILLCQTWLLRRRRGRQGPARRGAQRDGQGVRWCPFHARTRRCRPGEGRQAPDRERKPETGFLRPSVFGPCRCSSRRTGRKPSARSTDMPRTRAFKTPRSRPKF